MAFFVDEKKVHFHKTYLDRIPRRYLPVYSGDARFGDIEVSLKVRRNTQGTKYYWIFVFLGRTFVFWTDSFDTMYVGEFNHVCLAYVSAFKDQISKNEKVCSALIQKSFE